MSLHELHYTVRANTVRSVVRDIYRYIEDNDKDSAVRVEVFVKAEGLDGTETYTVDTVMNFYRDMSMEQAEKILLDKLITAGAVAMEGKIHYSRMTSIRVKGAYLHGDSPLRVPQKLISQERVDDIVWRDIMTKWREALRKMDDDCPRTVDREIVERVESGWL